MMKTTLGKIKKIGAEAILVLTLMKEDSLNSLAESSDASK